MTAQEKLDWIMAEIASGKSVYFQTHLHCTKVDKRTFDRWNKSGDRLFLVDPDGNLRMASGKKFVIVDYCKIYSA